MSETTRTAEVRLPADGAYAYVLRTTAAALAARVDFTLDDIEDLRIAVSEALSLLLDSAAPDADLTATFTLSPGRMVIEVSAPTAPGSDGADIEGFAWQVLSALAEDASLDWRDGHQVLSLTMLSTLAAH